MKPIKLLIVGSVDNIEPTKVEDFKRACRELGEAIAKAHLEIVIASSRRSRAARYVLEGVAAKIAGPHRHRVWILRIEDGRTPFDDPSEFDKRVEFIRKRLPGDWRTVRVSQIQFADAVLLIGGDSGTLSCGYLAPVLEKPVLPIGSFGGTATDPNLWRNLARYYQVSKLSEEVGKFREHWEPGNAEAAVDTIQQLVRSRAFKNQPRLPLGIYMPLLLACLAGWVTLFALHQCIKSG
jgi:hypothetical protein